jgi:hypothetical protein
MNEEDTIRKLPDGSYVGVNAEDGCNILFAEEDLQRCLKVLRSVEEEDIELFLKLMRHVQRAEQLHPAFAEGIYQGLGRIGEEYGELVRACNHEEGEKRIMEEAMDTLAVAWRFVRGDWGED